MSRQGYYLFRCSLSLSSSLSRGGSLSRGTQTLLCPHWPEVLQAGISSFFLSSHLHQALIQQASSCPSRSHPPTGSSLNPLGPGSRWGAAAAITMPATQTSEIGR